MLWLNGFVVVPDSEDLLVCFYDVVDSSCEFGSEFALYGRVVYGLSVPGAVGSDGVIVAGSLGDVFDLSVDGCLFRLRLRECGTVNVFGDFSVVRGLLRSALRLKVLGSSDFGWFSYNPCFSRFESMGDLGLRRCFKFSFELVGRDVVLFADVFTRLFSLRSLSEIFGFDLVKFKSLLVGSRVSYMFEGSFTVVDVLDSSVSDPVIINGVKTSVLSYIRDKYGDDVADKINPRESIVVGVASSNGRSYFFPPSLLRLVPSFDNLSRFSPYLGIKSVKAVSERLRLEGDRWVLLSEFIEFVDPLYLGDVRFEFAHEPFAFNV